MFIYRTNLGKNLPLILLILLIFSSCAEQKSAGGAEDQDIEYYITVGKEYQETFRDLFTLLSLETQGGEQQFSVVREIANEYMRLGEFGKLINFLSSWVDRHPEDPYNAYHLLMTAYAYIQQDAEAVAALYFDLILKNYPDLQIRGESIHLICLKQLIELSGDPERKVRHYQELISRFPDKIDLGSSYFMLAQAYEQIGEWSRVIQAYTQFLPYYNTAIPGFPDAFSYANQIVDFNKSAKDWTFDSLSSLVNAVELAIDRGSSAQLERCRAKVNFFARSWEQESSDNAGMVEFNLSDFMRGNRIRYSQELDVSSNANEAYLRTSGWSQYISVWYLYFRKIYFPADPEIHGRWEWAGVYYGEKM